MWMDTIDETVTGVVRLLTSFLKTGDVEVLADARKGITSLAVREVEVALPLWDLCITIQRDRLETGEDGDSE